MGFTVAADGRVLASGHPDLRTPELQTEGKPPLLGLVESTDQGRSWVPVSLLGDVDFHALEVRGDVVYGADSTSGRFMVSRDGGTTWSTRSKPGVFDFDVPPEDGNVVVGLGESGATRSTDGGRTFRPLDAPRLAVVQWVSRGLYGATPDGQLLVSKDRGDHWTTLGRLPGPPEALLVTDDAVVAAVSDVGIVESTNEGRTWEVRYSPDGSDSPHP
jgi:photosystem II stability/assembly factor-like uncharacterized protein